jgi:hypothetical protein
MVKLHYDNDVRLKTKRDISLSEHMFVFMTSIDPIKWNVTGNLQIIDSL